MTFKQNTKMSASGSHYCAGGKVKKMAEGRSTGFVDVPQTAKSSGPAPMLKDVLAATRSPTGRTATPSEVQAAIKNAPRMTARERAFSGADNPEKSRAVDMPMGEAKPITVAPRGSVGSVGGVSAMQLKKGGKVTRGNKKK